VSVLHLMKLFVNSFFFFLLKRPPGKEGEERLSNEAKWPIALVNFDKNFVIN